MTKKDSIDAFLTVKISAVSDAKVQSMLLGTEVSSAIMIQQSLGMKNDLTYQGFDPRHTYSLLKNKERDPTTLCRNLWFFTCLVALRGNNFKRIQDRSSDVLVGRMDMMKSKYGITTYKKTGYTRNYILLSRIVALFPQMTCMITKAYQHFPVNESEISDFHWYMRTTYFAGMIPTKVPGAARLKELHLKYLIEFDKVIHSKDGKYSKPEEIKRYQQAAISSAFYSESQRIKMLIP